MEAKGALPEPWVRETGLAGDASHRRYSRIWDSNDRTAILARYPHTVRGQLARDLEARKWCVAHGLRVPALLDSDLDAGWVVFEDFGPDDAEISLEKTAAAERSALARRLCGPLATLAKLRPSDLPPWNPPLDRVRLRWELAGFELWFVRHHLKFTPTPAIGRWLDELAAAIDKHPRRVCHRDYHLNNLFVLQDGAVGLIDYQDVLVGPDTYDAVSLLGERALPRLLQEKERAEVQRAWAKHTDVRPGWRERWLLVRAQRALKVLGTFSRLVASGAEPYGSWMNALALETGPELSALGAPTDLVDLLLDLARRRHVRQNEPGGNAAPT
jgi:aminoglycoside/choline kinase family phosphotransferase